METWKTLLCVAVGGSVGAMLRFGIANFVNTVWEDGFPLATFVANLVGCFLMGILIGSGASQQYPVIRLSVGVGFLGSLTTFSTFSADTLGQLNEGQFLAASGYALVSVVAGVALTMLGISISSYLQNTFN